jgi:aminoglycoside/choline kinase family phosphotransferase
VSYEKEKILNAFQKLIHGKFGQGLDDAAELKADASERKIYRLFIEGKTLVGVYNDNIKENLAFINFTKTFIELGLNVPEILIVSEDNLFYIEEDLGDDTLFKLMSSIAGKKKLFGYYKLALADLIRFQTESKDKIDYNYCYHTKDYDCEVIDSDFKKFNQYFSKTFLNTTLEQSLVEYILTVSDKVISNVRNNFFLYRDFQPRNIMIKENRLYYIDYQSGRKGPLQYDVASFLYSGSIRLDEDERNSLLDYYISELNKYITYDEKEFKHYFYFFVFLRLVQVLGSYAYLYKTRKDKSVIKKISKALINLKSIEVKIQNSEIKNLIVELTSSGYLSDSSGVILC